VKILALGDTHGRGTWYPIVTKYIDAVDKIVFIGDYFDSHEIGISAAMQIYNFKKIMLFKKEYPDKIETLIGNHDYHYFEEVDETYSGYQSTARWDISAAINEYRPDLKVCYIVGKYVFSHAGLTKTWCEKANINLESLEQSVNDLFVYRPRAFRFSGHDVYGDNITQGPFWVRPISLKADKLDNYTFIVGHTNQKEVKIKDNIVLIDAMESGEFIIVDTETDEIEIKKWKFKKEK